MLVDELRGFTLPANTGSRFTASAMFVTAILLSWSVPRTDTGVGAS